MLIRKKLKKERNEIPNPLIMFFAQNMSLNNSNSAEKETNTRNKQT